MNVIPVIINRDPFVHQLEFELFFQLGRYSLTSIHRCYEARVYTYSVLSIFLHTFQRVTDDCSRGVYYWPSLTCLDNRAYTIIDFGKYRCFSSFLIGSSRFNCGKLMETASGEGSSQTWAWVRVGRHSKEKVDSLPLFPWSFFHNEGDMSTYCCWAVEAACNSARIGRMWKKVQAQVRIAGQLVTLSPGSHGKGRRFGLTASANSADNSAFSPISTILSTFTCPASKNVIADKNLLGYNMTTVSKSLLEIIFFSYTSNSKEWLIVKVLVAMKYHTFTDRVE